MSRRLLSKMPRASLAIAGVLGMLAVSALPAGASGGFTAGNLVVYRVGNGTAALSSAATPVFLDEYPTTASSAPAFTLALPTTAGTPAAVTSSGTATSEGELTLSTDGTHLLATGYNTTVGTLGVAGTSSSASANQRVVAEIDGNANVDTSTAFSALYSGNNIRSAASPTGTMLYAAGPTNGVVETTQGSTTGTQLTPSTGDINFRVANIFGGQLYASSASGAGIGIDAIGSGLPTSSTTVSNLPGLDNGSSASPYGFVLFNETGGIGPDTAYVADSTAGKILKYVLTSGTWVADGSAGSTATTGVTGLTGTYSSGTATLYATSPTNLVSLTDATGQGTLTATPATLATAATNEAFRGVAFAPTSAGTPVLPEAPLAALLPVTGGLAIAALAFTRRRRSHRLATA